MQFVRCRIVASSAVSKPNSHPVALAETCSAISGGPDGATVSSCRPNAMLDWLPGRPAVAEEIQRPAMPIIMSRMDQSHRGTVFDAIGLHVWREGCCRAEALRVCLPLRHGAAIPK
jgi:hypothetical protein